jgi:hypothetical protein
MAVQFFIYLGVFAALAAGLYWRKRRKRRRAARSIAAEDHSLWSGLAAGLFDSSDSPASARLEVALLAIARKLRLRGGIVVRIEGEFARVIASVALSESLIEGLAQGTVVSRRALYFGSVPSGSTLAVDYASLSEWRKHEACIQRGWEAFLGTDCGEAGASRMIAGFFDTSPRDQLFTRAESALLEQMAPWLGTLAQERAGSEISTFRIPQFEISNNEIEGVQS